MSTIVFRGRVFDYKSEDGTSRYVLNADQILQMEISPSSAAASSSDEPMYQLVITLKGKTFVTEPNPVEGEEAKVSVKDRRFTLVDKDVKQLNTIADQFISAINVDVPSTQSLAESKESMNQVD